MKKYIFIVLFAFLSCDNAIKLNQDAKKEYRFNELPDTIKFFMKKIFKQKEQYHDTVMTYSINKNEKFEYLKKRPTYWILQEFNCQFKINAKTYKINGNLEDPFIYYNKKIYFPEYNTYLKNYLNNKFYSIDLKEN